MLIAGLVLPASPFDLWKKGKGNDVPVIIGMKHIIYIIIEKTNI